MIMEKAHMAKHPHPRSKNTPPRPIWTGISSRDDVGGRVPVGQGPDPVSRQQVPAVARGHGDQYANLVLPAAYAPLPADWMRGYLRSCSPRSRIAAAGADVALIVCIIGFCAEHQACFDGQVARLRRLFQKAFPLKHRPRVAEELTRTATQLQVLDDLGMVGFVTGLLKLGGRLAKKHARSLRGEYVDFGELIPRAERTGGVLERKAIGWANLMDVRYLLSGNRGARATSVLNECAGAVAALLRRAGVTGPAVFKYTTRLLAPAFHHSTTSKAVYMRLKRRAEGWPLRNAHTPRWRSNVP
jgi:hypothetical protein